VERSWPVLILNKHSVIFFNRENFKVQPMTLHRNFTTPAYHDFILNKNLIISKFFVTAAITGIIVFQQCCQDFIR